VSKLLYRLGLACARRPKTVIVVWLIAVIAVVAVSRVAGDQTSNNLTLPGTDSTSATNLLESDLPDQANGNVPIVLHVDSGTLDTGANKQAVDATVTSLKKTDGVNSALSPFSSKASDNLSKDKQTAYVAVTLSISSADLDEDEANDIIAGADPAVKAGIQVEAGGYLGQEVSKPSTHVSEAIGIGVAVVILTLAFGTAVAMMLPISTAIIGLLLGLSLIGILGHAIEIPSIAPTLGTMIGLGVGIDYALFIVTRYKTRLQDGLPTDEAIARSCATSGSAVAFAGGTVVIALCSLQFANIPIVSALGYSAAIVVAIAVVGALTLLPALLGILGPKIHSLKVPVGGRHRHEDDHPHGWARWAEGVASHPWPALIVSVGLLVVLALPLTDMTLGQEDVGQLPESTTARQAYDLMGDSFGEGSNGPLLIAVSLDPPAKADTKKLDQLKQEQKQQQEQAENQAQQQASAQVPELTQQLIDEGVPQDEAQEQAEEEADEQAQQQVESEAPSAKKQKKINQQERFLKSTASDPRLTKLRNQISKDPGIDSISFPSVSKSGSGAVMSANPTTAPSSAKTEDTIVRLRDDVIPQAETGGATADVGGSTAAYVDLADRISERLVLVILIVVGLSFLLLTLAFRSIVVPITAALMNLLSVAAAYGVLVAVFEKGWGESLIGLDAKIPIVSFVPLLMFAVLFGLSMDYQVFLVSRIGEVWTKTGDNRKAVVHGLASSARVITSAALIMVAVFSSFILNGDPTVKQFGVGLAVAIAVDATIVRCLLVPAAMVLLGRSNWWLPGWLDRIIPNIGLESEDSLPPIEEPDKPSTTLKGV
jgi:RND superfamily putative drug exporter